MRKRDVAAVVERLAPNLRRLRLVAGLTQEQLAEVAAVDVSYVQRVERGVAVNVTIAVLGAFARALVVDVVRLLRPGKPQPRAPGRPRSTRRRKDGASTAGAAAHGTAAAPGGPRGNKR